MAKRRDHVPFDPRFFEKQDPQERASSAAETFRHIYLTRHWGAADSVSGEGAGRAQTRILEVLLPPLLHALDVEVLLDLPCGDFSWMRHVDLPVRQYIGGDVVPELIEANSRRYAADQRRFVVVDLTRDPLPKADLLFCRDALVHLSFDDIDRALRNIRHSGIPFLLTTTFPECEVNEDVPTGDWRPLNLCKPPFGFPRPRHLFNEGCTEGGGRFRDKSLGLWDVQTLPS